MAKMSGVSSTRRLRSLLVGAKDDLGLTLGKIVEQAGGRLKRSTAANLLKQEYRSEPLDRATLEAIADGFGVPYEQVREAHLADMGLLTTNYDAIVELAMSLTPVLGQLNSEVEQQVVLTVAKATAEAMQRNRPTAASPPPVPDLIFWDAQGTEASIVVEYKHRGHGVSEAAVLTHLMEQLTAAGFQAERPSAGRRRRSRLEAVPHHGAEPIAARRGRPEHAKGDEDQ